MRAARRRTSSAWRRRAGRLRRLGARRTAQRPSVVAGRDVPAPQARRRWRVRPAAAATVVGGAVCAALLLVALRADSIRLRYQLADAVRAEQALRDEQRRLVVELRRLRHPLRLEELGRELGLARPARGQEIALAPARAPSGAHR
jgi:cell division protein FtsL